MGKREKNLKATKPEEYASSSEEDKRKRIPIDDDDDDEANGDLSLKIVQKSMQRIVSNDPLDSGASEVVTEFKKERSKKMKKRRKKSKEIEIPGDNLDDIKDKEDPAKDKAVEVSTEAVEMTPAQLVDNVVLRKLLRGPRYFDPPDNNWGACYNCGEEGHITVNCTSAKRKKPCFVCGSFEHNAKQCIKDCFICKQHGHRAKDCTEKNNNSKLCLKCGDMGHEMLSCRNDYCPDDLKEIQCYICGRFGHLCCRSYIDPGPREISCYKCGLPGHTGLSCLGSYSDAVDNVSASSCYKCGLVGHFARECTTMLKRNREPSTPRQKSSKRNRDYIESKSAPNDFGKTRKKKNFQSSVHTSAPKAKQRGGWITEDPGRYNSPSKAKHRGGWSTEDPGDYYYANKSQPNGWRTPSTPIIRRPKISIPSSDYASSSRYSKMTHKANFNSTSNGSPRFYQHRYSASRFGNSNGDMGRNNNYW